MWRLITGVNDTVYRENARRNEPVTNDEDDRHDLCSVQCRLQNIEFCLQGKKRGSTSHRRWLYSQLRELIVSVLNTSVRICLLHFSFPPIITLIISPTPRVLNRTLHVALIIERHKPEECDHESENFELTNIWRNLEEKNWSPRSV